MLIKKLRLKNFRQYIGEQVIEFSTEREKNVTVLIGVNTSGKTTLIRAFEWILYNKNEFDDKMWPTECRWARRKQSEVLL